MPLTKMCTRIECKGNAFNAKIPKESDTQNHPFKETKKGIQFWKEMGYNFYLDSLYYVLCLLVLFIFILHYLFPLYVHPKKEFTF